MVRQSFPSDYDSYAPVYAKARRAVAWVLEPLARAVEELGPKAMVLELGCGTGNYVRALSTKSEALRCIGLDASMAMIKEARRLPGRVSYVVGNAEQNLPVADLTFDLVFAVDVIHHIDDLVQFFTEVERVLRKGRCCILVTDSENTFRRRSLTEHFPELMGIELARYHALASLQAAAEEAGLRQIAHESAAGQVPLTDEFVAALEAKCSSAMRMMPPSEHAAGMARVRAAQARGESWLSCYDVLYFTRQ